MLTRNLNPLFLFALVILTVQAELPAVPDQTVAVIIPQPTDNLGPLINPSDVPLPSKPRHFEKPDPIYRPLRGPSRM